MSKITNEMRKIFAKTAKPYGDPNKFQIKVVDLREAGRIIKERRIANNEATVVFVNPSKPDKHKDTENVYSYTKDPMHDVYYGIPIGTYPDGNVKWRKFHVLENHEFNLKNADDAAFFVFLMMHPKTEDSPFAIDDCVRKIYDPETAAQTNLLKTEMISEAIGRLPEIPSEELVGFARVLNVAIPDDISFKVLYSELNKVAIESPERFLAELDHPSRKRKQVFYAAKELGIIKSTEKGYIYEGYELGLHEERAIDAIKANSDLYVRLAMEVKDEDIYSERINEQGLESRKTIEKNIGAAKINKVETVLITYPDFSKTFTLKQLKDECDRVGLKYMGNIKIQTLMDKYKGHIEDYPEKMPTEDTFTVKEDSEENTSDN